jgi:hypothetical protein
MKEKGKAIQPNIDESFHFVQGAMIADSINALDSCTLLDDPA